MENEQRTNTKNSSHTETPAMPVHKFMLFSKECYQIYTFSKIKQIR